MFYKTNEGLGHNQYAYLIKVKEGYISLSGNNDWEIGELSKLSDISDLIPVTEEELRNNCDVNEELIGYIIKVEKERK